MTETKNEPVGKFTDGQVCATIWKNKIKNKEGNEFEVYSVNIVKNYKDKNDEWQTTNSFHENELVKVQFVTKEAYRKINELKKQEKN